MTAASSSAAQAADLVPGGAAGEAEAREAEATAMLAAMSPAEVRVLCACSSPKTGSVKQRAVPQ